MPPSIDIYTIFQSTEHVTSSPFLVNMYPQETNKSEHAFTKYNIDTGKDIFLNFTTAKAKSEISTINPLEDVLA